MARITVFGAGAMGTAMAMHLARGGQDVVLWGSEFDQYVLPLLAEDRRHPALPEHLPESLRVMGPDHLGEAAADVDIAVMGAHSGGARTLARMVVESAAHLPLVVSIAKGLEPDTLQRMSDVYSEEVGHELVVSVGGPCLADEIASGLPTAAVFAADSEAPRKQVGEAFRSKSFHVHETDDVAGLEYCAVGKNVAAIGIGMLDGIGKTSNANYRNAKAALFTQAVDELTAFAVALGGREETAKGLAGLGDTLVTSLGGRNRLYGELIGEGGDPERAREELDARGMTVEGVDSTRDVQTLAEQKGLDLPLFAQVHRVLFGGEPAATILDVMT